MEENRNFGNEKDEPVCCPACGAPAKPGAKFCSACGRALPSTAQTGFTIGTSAHDREQIDGASGKDESPAANQGKDGSSTGAVDPVNAGDGTPVIHGESDTRIVGQERMENNDSLFHGSPQAGNPLFYGQGESNRQTVGGAAVGPNISAPIGSAYPSGGQQKRKWGAGRILALVLPLAAVFLILAAVGIGLIIHSTSQVKTVAAQVYIEDDYEDIWMPCAAQIAQEGDNWVLESLALPFQVTIQPENELHFAGIDPTASYYIISGAVMGEIAFQDTPPDLDAMLAFEQEQQERGIFVACAGDSVFHISWLECETMDGSQPDLWFIQTSLPYFYGLTACPACMEQIDAQLESWDSQANDPALDALLGDLKDLESAPPPVIPTPDAQTESSENGFGNGFSGSNSGNSGYSYGYPGNYGGEGSSGTTGTHICSWLGCHERSDHKYCDRHRCTVSGCEKERIQEDCSYCYDHVCHYDGCQNRALDSLDCCSQHKCAAEGCNNTQMPEKRFCWEHACHADGCQNSNDSHTYCDTHRCDYPGCESYTSTGNACEAHTCNSPSCNNTQLENRLYCSRHNCAAVVYGTRPWCTNQAEPGIPFCSEHKCFATGCQEQKLPSKPYCKNHACAVSGCEVQAIAGKRCCVLHKCAVDGCWELKNSSSDFCTNHKCKSCSKRGDYKDGYCYDCYYNGYYG